MPANTPFDPNDVIRGSLGLDTEEIEIEDPAITAALKRAEEKAEREIEEIRARAEKEKEMIKRGETPAKETFESDMDPVAFAPDSTMKKLMEESLLKIEQQNQALKDSLSSSAQMQQDFQNQLNMNHSLQELENNWNKIEEALEKKTNK